MQTPVIMLVEDDPDLREQLGDGLRDAGYSVIACENGDAALNAIHTAPALSLIVLDLMMPVTDGWGFRAIQQRLPGHSGVPVLLMSGRGDAEAIAAQMGAVGCLRKPFSIDRFLQAVKRSLGNPGTEPG